MEWFCFCEGFFSDVIRKSGIQFDSFYRTFYICHLKTYWTNICIIIVILITATLPCHRVMLACQDGEYIQGHLLWYTILKDLHGKN